MIFAKSTTVENDGSDDFRVFDNSVDGHVPCIVLYEMCMKVEALEIEIHTENIQNHKDSPRNCTTINQKGPNIDGRDEYDSREGYDVGRGLGGMIQIGEDRLMVQ